MSAIAIVYTPTQQAIVSAFESSANAAASYWFDGSIKDFKLDIKRHYVKAQGYTCCYCRRPNAEQHMIAWTTDHIVPRASHPLFMFTPLNLSAACPTCNQRKSHKQPLVDDSVGKYPTASNAFLLVHPHYDRYAEHIQAGTLNYVPISEKGAWTYDACGLERFAEMSVGWPEETIADDRFEEEVEAVMSGDDSVIADLIRDVS